MNAHPLLARLVRPIPDDGVYRNRLARELDLVNQNRFTECFLQVVEIMELTRDIPHIVRGSAGSSLLCYLLGITNFDPIAENIPLARFMHDLRQDQPDIDIDFPHHLRDEVLRRVREQFPERVARISNHIHYRENSALREAIRRHGYHKFVPKHFDLEEIFGPEEARAVEADALALVGTPRGESLHCGGVIIFPEAVPEELLLAPGQIRLDKDEVEAAGLIKIDLLCNRGMSILWECDQRPVEEYPDRDPGVVDLLCRADTLGVVYGESPTMRKALRAIQPRCRADVALALALIRPAAASRGPRKSAFLENWRNRREQTHLVYDDDAIQLIQRLIGCSEAQAEVYRRGFAKGNEAVIREVAGLIAGMEDRGEILEDLGRMRNYSFCKSHAISYSYLVWGLAYQKVNQPHRFWQATLNHAQSIYRPWVHVQEAKRAGLRFEMGRAPWSLVGDTLVSPGRQRRFFEDGWAQFRERGYWASPRFMPGMYFHLDGDRIEFRGLIATHKQWEGNGDRLTFATLGTGQDYWDLSIPTHEPLDLWDAISGRGVLLDLHGSLTIQAEEYWLERF